MTRWNRFLLVLTLAMAPCVASAADAKKVIIIGIDGMDPNLLKEFVAAGVMPNFQKLIGEGDFKPLQTSMPPLSPVAWSSFITGLDPGGHGIFDFVHRDPVTQTPFSSTSRSSPASRTIEIGSWSLPLSSGKIEFMRKGKAFWQMLEDQGIPTTIFKMPANFPPVASNGYSLSGMGTPDVLGTPGMFSFFTNHPPANRHEVTGGTVYDVQVINNRVDAKLTGPANTFRILSKKAGGEKGASQIEHPDCTVDFSVFIDPRERAAKFEVQGNEFILKQGEWSDWIRVDFKPVPLLVSVSAICRFYLQQARPDFKLYVSPLQINPENPAMPISTPQNWSRELQKQLGYFHTKELPEETKALSAGIFTGQEFWTQLQAVFAEQRKALDLILSEHKEGLRFFYFSSIDQGCHMLWRYADMKHPAFDSKEKLQDGIKTLYQQIDESLGHVLKAVDANTTLIVMSDHGFSPFYRGVNLNSWLLEQNYVHLKDPAKGRRLPYFGGVDWTKTKAYAVGLNGLYVNLKGREKDGIVNPGAEYDALLDELEKGLLALRDPKDGSPAVTLIVRTHRDFQGPWLDAGPDIIVGYNKGYRSSWESPLGEFPEALFVDNNKAWSGDHSCDYRFVPGILITNQRITVDDPSLMDLTVGVLDEFGVKPLPEMRGRDCLAPREAKAPASAGR